MENVDAKRTSGELEHANMELASARIVVKHGPNNLTKWSVAFGVEECQSANDRVNHVTRSDMRETDILAGPSKRQSKVVPNVFDEGSLEEGSFRTVGLASCKAKGTRVVYCGIERLIEGLAGEESDFRSRIVCGFVPHGLNSHNGQLMRLQSVERLT